MIQHFESLQERIAWVSGAWCFDARCAQASTARAILGWVHKSRFENKLKPQHGKLNYAVHMEAEICERRICADLMTSIGQQSRENCRLKNIDHHIAQLKGWSSYNTFLRLNNIDQDIAQLKVWSSNTCTGNLSIVALL
jgi:hypothetical protein